MRKILPFLLIFTLLTSILVFPSFALTSTASSDVVLESPYQLNVTVNSVSQTLTPSVTDEIVFNSGSYLTYPSSFEGMTAYRSKFDLPSIGNYSTLQLFWKQYLSRDVWSQFSNADEFYGTMTLCFSCTSTNFVWPSTVDLYWGPLSSTFELISSSSGAGVYTGTIEITRDVVDIFTEPSTASVYFTMNQMQGMSVYFAVSALPAMFTASYTQAEALQQATYDIVASGISPTVQNISVQADKIIQQQEQISDQIGEIQGSLDTMNNTLESMPEEIGDEVQDALESAADQEYNQAMQDGQENVDELLSSVDIDTESFFTGIKNLISGLSYTGTDAVWTFPALAIPEVAGIGPFQLSEEVDIDISAYIDQYLPDVIHALIQYILSAALGLFLIYEVMTLVLQILGVTTDMIGIDQRAEDRSYILSKRK